MIPLRDNIPSRTVPILNYSFIALCTIVFVLQLAEGTGVENAEESSFVDRYGMIPALVQHPDRPLIVEHRYLDRQQRQVVIVERRITPTISPWLTLLTCTFLHGGWLHFLGNMWFLHIFGDNVEDRLGHVGYTIFYLAAGVFASLSHLLTNPESGIPTIGASGAIAGVMGAYLLLYPRAQVESIVPVFGFVQFMVIPAPLFLGVWFLMQLFQGTAAITTTATTGVAWWAHIGGFAAGVAAAALLRMLGQTTPPVERRRIREDDARTFRWRR